MKPMHTVKKSLGVYIQATSMRDLGLKMGDPDGYLRVGDKVKIKGTDEIRTVAKLIDLGAITQIELENM